MDQSGTDSSEHSHDLAKFHANVSFEGDSSYREKDLLV